MRLRSYQAAAVAGIAREHAQHQATLAVLPTGCGKTVIFAHALRRCLERGRAMIVAHRTELLDQAADKIRRIAEVPVATEQAQQWADTDPDMYGEPSRAVVASVQTLNASWGERARMERFEPSEFSLLVIDEAHHATATSYRRVIDHFRRNPECKILGVTATPDRHDEEALGQIFESVAFEYRIQDAIRDGYLVPIVQQAIIVDGLDFSAIKTVAGDLSGAELARVMEHEETLHRIATPIYDISHNKKTLVFCASVAHADRMAEILNRHEANSAECVTGSTPTDERRDIFRRFARKDTRFLCNVGVATEGFDDPSIDIIAIARPTKSRALYAQMVGRGFRPLPGLVDGIEDHESQLLIGDGRIATPAELRKRAITTSDKPHVLVLDFVGVSGKHKLITAVDILGGKYSDEVIALAERKARGSKGAAPVQQLLDEAQQEIMDRNRRRQEEAKKRQAVKAKASYAVTHVDPFAFVDMSTLREPGWGKHQPPSEAQIRALRAVCARLKTDAQPILAQKPSKGRMSAILDQLMQRDRNQPCSPRQAWFISHNFGLPYREAAKLTKAEAGEMIGKLKQGATA